MCGGGSGGGGQTQYNWNDDMAPQWRAVLGDANNVYNTPYQAYKGGDPNAMVAGLTGDQLTAMNQIRGYTSDPRYSVQDPNQAQNAGIAMEQGTLGGMFLNGPGSDPYATAKSSYGGQSPAFQSMMDQGSQDLINQYKMGTDADTTRMFNLSGAFGGSAYQNAVGANQYALGKSLSGFDSGMLNDQYNRSAQLEQQDLARGSTAYQDERNRQIQTLNPTQNEQSLAMQRAQALMANGDISRSYNQDILNANYNTYNQAKQYPYTQLDYLTGILSRAQGGVSPNSTTTQSGYNASPYSMLLGAGLLGSSLYGGH